MPIEKSIQMVKFVIAGDPKNKITPNNKMKLNRKMKENMFNK